MHLNSGFEMGDNGFGGPAVIINDNDGDGAAAIRLALGLGTRFELDAAGTGFGCDMRMHDSGGRKAIEFIAEDTGADSARLDLFDPLDGSPRVSLRAQETGGTGAAMWLFNSIGIDTIKIDADAFGAGRIDIRRATGSARIKLAGDDGVAGGGTAAILNGVGVHTITFNGDHSGTGRGRIICDEIEIRGGADLVEAFNAGDENPEPGTVMAIDPDSPGQVRIATGIYDRCVAGVVSGAGGIQAGVHLAQTGTLDGDTPLALTGRVYVKCSAENGAIRPGNLLTSASLAGHAMLATDSSRAFGAVIGKAMGSLDEGTGLVLVLVGLQ